MAILPILIAPHPLLRRKAVRINVFDDALAALVEDMFETLYDAPGIGLAAPQVSVGKRLVVMDCGVHPDGDYTEERCVFINPELLGKEGEAVPYDEGCLSLPGYKVSIERPETACVRYQDIHGKSHHETFHGLAARCIQHEIDHLNGVLIVDYASQLVRSRILRELHDQKKAVEAKEASA